MPHLSPERLAALADEPATHEEQSHLAQCGTCLGELRAMRRVVALAGDTRDRVGPPLTTWESVSREWQRAQAAGEGFVAPAGVVPVVPRRTFWSSPAWRIAAAAALLVGGVAGGRLSAGARVIPNTGRGVEMATASSGDSGVMTVANVPTFATREEAAAALDEAERTYRAAAAYITSQDTTGAYDGRSDAQVRTRLAALDDMVATSRAALYAAPQDPVINQYYLATLGAREATLRQLGGAAQPVNLRVAY